MKKEHVRQFGGKASYLAFAKYIGGPDFPKWEELDETVKEAWIAAAHEACMLQWIVENHKDGDVA